MTTILPVILSGGSGTRLWPLSRPDCPKQLLPLPGPDTMIQATARRLDAIRTPLEQPVVVANQAHAELILRQLAAIDVTPTVIVEPEGRNTAPAVALAAHYAVATGNGDAALLVMPADHTIADEAAFARSIDAALPAARDGALVTFGIVPDEPHTGYGYIRAGTRGEPGPVESFVEKPDRPHAERYVASGDYYWNAGIFMFSARVYLDELARCAPDIADACAESMANVAMDGLVAPDAVAFGRVRPESIDYAVMEETDAAWVVPMDAGWSDVGSWSALCDVLPADDDGNVLSGNVVTHDTRHTGVFAYERTVAVAGLDDAIVVETGDCVLVTTRAASQAVKKLVGALIERGDAVAKEHRRRRYGWGFVEPLAVPAEPRLSCITIEPGASCGLVAADGARLIGATGTVSAFASTGEYTIDTSTAVTLDAGGDVRLVNPGDTPASIVVQGVHVSE